MPDIEFVDDDADSNTPADDASAPVARKGPRLVVIGAVVALVVAAILVGTLRNDASPQAGSVTEVTVPDSAPATPRDVSFSASPPVPSTGHVLRALAVGDRSAPVLAVAVTDSQKLVLQATTLYAIPQSGRTRSVTVSAASDFLTANLVLDQPSDVVWVVYTTDEGAQIDAYRLPTLRHLTGVLRRGSFSGEAAMSGQLYLSSGDDLVSVSQSGAVRSVGAASFPIGQLAADPIRNRVLAVSAPGVGPGRIVAVSPRTGNQLDTPTELADATLAVSRTGEIWLAGATSAPVLRQLDPDTLATRLSFLDPGTGTTLVAGGDRVIWARTADSTVAGLSCFDARTGALLQQWQIGGSVASNSGSAVVATVAGVRPLLLGKCAG